MRPEVIEVAHQRVIDVRGHRDGGNRLVGLQDGEYFV